MIHPLFPLMRWLQTVPLAPLLFTPFRDEELRIDRRPACLAAAAYVSLGSVGLAALGSAASLEGQRNIVARELVLAVILAVGLAAWAWAVRAGAVRKLLVVVCLLHYEGMLYAISSVAAALILGEGCAAQTGSGTGSLTFDLCMLAAVAATWPLVWFFFRRILRRDLLLLDSRNAARGLGYLCVVFLVFAAAVYEPRYELWPETPVFVAALIVTDMIAYYIFFQEIGAVQLQAETARQLLDYQIQYQGIVSRMEDVRRLRHDVRHHLNVLSALNAQGKTEEIAAYLQQYGKVYDQMEQQRFCGDAAVDGVLGYYLAQAGEEDVAIDCKVLLRGGSGVEHMDMTVLLGNCLENAMEALRRLPPEERRLSVGLQPSGAMLLLRVVNTCEAEADTAGFADWHCFPSGKGRGRMGVGLRSIAEIAEKYGGSAQFQRRNGEFTVRVVLCMASEGQGGAQSNRDADVSARGRMR